jgi:SNF2 family DNA or RNA helicase
LPAPVAPKTKTLKKSTPTIHLHLHRANPFSHGGHHLSGKPEPVIATLTFQYHGHEFMPDLAAEPSGEATFTATTKNTLYTIPRDTSFERNTILDLVREHEIVPAGAIDDQIAPDHRSAFLPRTPPAEWDAAAAEFLQHGVPRLEEQGWQITIADEARFEVHHIGDGDLETGLTEDPENGIDWFRFSASFLTPEGEKQPLLPLLSSFLKTLDFESLDDSFDDQLRDLGEDHETLLRDPEDPQTFLAFPTTRLLRLAKTLHDLFGNHSPDEPLHRLQAASLADELEMDSSQTLKDLAALGSRLHNLSKLPQPKPPKALQGTLRDYQLEGFHWMQFLARHSLHGILADDMGLGKTIQTLAHLQAEVSGRRTQKTPSLVIAPTSVTGNWQAEAKKFTPKLKTLHLHGPDRHEQFVRIPEAHLVITSYALLVRDFDRLKDQDFHLIILDEAQYIKNPVAKVSQRVCKLRARHRLSLSGTPLENHLGELWSQMRFLMPGLLGSSEAFRKKFRTPIERHQDATARLTLASRVAPLILHRTKDAVATELPPKTDILHTIPLNKGQVDLYETVRAAMDDRIRDAIADKGLAKSQIVVLDALLKLRQICCHPQLLKIPAARQVKDSAKLDFLTTDLLPTLLEEGRKILLFSTFTTMLALIEEHLKKKKIAFSKITGSTKDRQKEIAKFQDGKTPVFLISLKAGGTGLNLTAADTVIHYDPWWNPAAENQATDRAYRIGQDKPVFVHKLISEGTIEERIVQLQSQKAKLVEALLSEETSKLNLDKETLANLLAPLE